MDINLTSKINISFQPRNTLQTFSQFRQFLEIKNNHLHKPYQSETASYNVTCHKILCKPITKGFIESTKRCKGNSLWNSTEKEFPSVGYTRIRIIHTQSHSQSSASAFIKINETRKYYFLLLIKPQGRLDVY